MDDVELSSEGSFTISSPVFDTCYFCKFIPCECEQFGLEAEGFPAYHGSSALWDKNADIDLYKVFEKNTPNSTKGEKEKQPHLHMPGAEDVTKQQRQYMHEQNLGLPVDSYPASKQDLSLLFPNGIFSASSSDIAQAPIQQKEKKEKDNKATKKAERQKQEREKKAEKREREKQRRAEIRAEKKKQEQEKKLIKSPVPLFQIFSLKTDRSVVLKKKTSLYLETNFHILPEQKLCGFKVVRVPQDTWPAQRPWQVQEGLISPGFEGKLKVRVFNPMDEIIRMEEGCWVANLEVCAYINTD